MTSVAEELRAGRTPTRCGAETRRGAWSTAFARASASASRARSILAPEPTLQPLRPAMPDRIDVRTDGGATGCRRARSSPGSGRCCTTAPCPASTSATWRFEVTRRGGAAARRSPGTSCWRCPGRRPLCDIHCVTRWSRYDNVFEGVPVQALLRRGRRPARGALRRWCTPSRASPPTCRSRTSTGRPTCSRSRHNGEPLTPEHGGPVRLLVPHLYFWKSAKWVTGFELLEEDYPGFWEQNGYHMRGDPWARGALRAARSGADAARAADESAQRVLPLRGQPGFPV